MAIVNLLAKLGLDTSSVDVGLKRTRSQFRAWGRDVSRSVTGYLGVAFGAAAIGRATKDTIAYATKVRDLGNAFSIGTDKIQEWTYALEQNGATQEDLATAFRTLARSRDLALQSPTGQQAKDFLALGVDTSTADVGNLFDQIGRKIKDANGNQQLLGASMRLMGRSADRIMPAMIEGFDSAARAARDLGAIIDGEVIQSLADVGDQFTDLKYMMQGPFAQGVAYGLGKLTTALDDIARTTAYVVGFYDLKMKGMSSQDAARAALNATAESEQKSADRKASMRSRAARALGRMQTIDTASPTSSSQAASSTTVLGGNLNALQRVGAFSGTTTVFSELKRHSDYLRDIRNNTKPQDGPGGTAENY